MIYFTPGPTQLYPSIKKHIQAAVKDDIPSLSHRSDKFYKTVKDTCQSLRRLLKIPATYEIYFLASGTEAMERLIQNCAGDRTAHFVNGAFSKRFYQIAKDLKKSPELYEANVGEAWDFPSISLPKNTEILCFTHNETSGGTAIPLEEIYTFAGRFPDALVALDVVSSAPYVTLDFTNLDCVFFSSQKGFGLPAGLGVLIVSPRALAKAQKLKNEGFNVGSYHQFETLSKHAKKFQTIETPNVLNIYLLNAVLHDMLDVGIQTIRKRTEQKAAYLYDFFDKHPTLHPFVQDKNYRSKTVIVIATPKGSSAILSKLKGQGFTVGSGYGELKDKQIRIANFPGHTMADIKRLVACISKIQP